MGGGGKLGNGIEEVGADGGRRGNAVEDAEATERTVGCWRGCFEDAEGMTVEALTGEESGRGTA